MVVHIGFFGIRSDVRHNVYKTPGSSDKKVKSRDVDNISLGTEFYS